MKQKDIQLYSPACIDTLPEKPGVYIMKDEDGNVLYVGKAKNIKSRVRSYFKGGDERYSVNFLVKLVSSIETVITENERQALVLESDLIKKFKPRYNVRLKDDKAYIVVRINTAHEWPRVEVVRRIIDDGSRYFGPFPFGYEIRTMLDIIKRTLPLRTCSDRVLRNRVRPCLEYQIKRCSAPCCIEVSKTKYLDWVEQAIALLQGNVEYVCGALEEEMLSASSNMRFEDAAVLRDRIDILKKFAEAKPSCTTSFGSRDGIGMVREGSRVEFTVLLVRQGRLYESKSYGFTDVDMPNDELLSTFIGQYYSDVTLIPDEVLLPFEIEDADVRQDYLSDIYNTKTTIGVPKRGHKARLVNLAILNARENFNARFLEIENEQLLLALKKELGMDKLPRMIACADVSHLQGTNTVASVVVFKDGRPDKSLYRHFRLNKHSGDDFAAMQEVVRRYLSREIEENTQSDLFVVDGGPGQLAQAIRVRSELGLNTPFMIGLAKERSAEFNLKVKLRSKAKNRREGFTKSQKDNEYLENVEAKPERVYIEGKVSAVVINAHSDALLLLQRIRDEAHRFAVRFQRHVRAMSISRSALNGIQGVGPKRQRLLLKEFKSISNIKKASAEELSSRCNIPINIAKKIISKL